MVFTAVQLSWLRRRRYRIIFDVIAYYCTRTRFKTTFPLLFNVLLKLLEQKLHQFLLSVFDPFFIVGHIPLVYSTSFHTEESPTPLLCRLSLVPNSSPKSHATVPYKGITPCKQKLHSQVYYMVDVHILQIVSPSCLIMLPPLVRRNLTKFDLDPLFKIFLWNCHKKILNTTRTIYLKRFDWPFFCYM